MGLASCLFDVILGLGIPQGGVEAICVEQCFVTAPLRDGTVLEDQNVLAEPAAAHTVGDVDAGFVPDQFVETGVDFILAEWVQGGGGFVQDDERRILIQGPCNGDFLHLTAAQVFSGFFQRCDRRLQPLVHVPDSVRYTGQLQALPHPLRIRIQAGAYVLAHREGEELEVLENDAEQALVLLVVVFPNVYAIEGDVSFCGVIKTAQKLDEGGFASAIETDHSHFVLQRQLAGQMLQDRGAASGVGEGDVVEGNFVYVVLAFFCGNGAGVTAGLVQETQKVFQVGHLAAELAVLPEDAHNVALERSQCAGILGKGTDGDGPHQDLEQDQNIGVDGGKTRQGGGNDGQVQLGPAHVHIYRTSNAEETLIIFHQHIFHVV